MRPVLARAVGQPLLRDRQRSWRRVLARFTREQTEYFKVLASSVYEVP